jgi:deoxyuridine 5'-triphosphate nucleotidohydrolase
MGKLRVKILKDPIADPQVLTPVRGSKGAAGYDFCSSINITIQPKTRELVPTGIILEIPEGYYLQLKSRSGLAFRRVDTQAGTIDEDYRGEIKILIDNTDDSPLVITATDRIAQGIFRKYEEVEFEEVSDFKQLSVTERGGKGFGSTGMSTIISKAAEKVKVEEVSGEEKKVSTRDESLMLAPGDAGNLGGL